MAQALNWSALSDALPLLAAFPGQLRAAATLRHLGKGGVIFRRGDRPRSMLAVLSGEVRLVRSSPAGSEVILQRTRRGFMAEASLDQARYHCDAVAALPTALICIPRGTFKEALADEEFRSRWTAELLHELRRVRAQCERLSLHSARDRIIHYIEADGRNGSVQLTHSKKDWAAELGLTHEALYRTLSRMERVGDLRIEGQIVSLTVSQSA